MDQSNNTLWELEPHTEAKHVILRNYLKAWYRIVGTRFPRLLFVDGYSGPGEYIGSEDGSPMIALKEAMNFLSYCDSRKIKKPLIYLKFIEKDKDHYEYLYNKINAIKIKPEIKVDVINSNFEKSGKDIEEILNSFYFRGMPKFIFIDPFGYNISLKLIESFMRSDKCEVFINFMYEFVNRFLRRSGQDTVLNKLFGTDIWQEINKIDYSPSERKNKIHGLYQLQLENRCAKYVRSFEMRGARDTTKYFLFYGTNHRLGLEKMKESMWSLDKSGSFSFSDATDPDQLVLFGNEPDFLYLKRLISSNFRNKTIGVELIEDYVICNTPFLKTHYKRVLVEMENSGALSVTSPRKRALSYPEGTVIKVLL